MAGVVQELPLRVPRGGGPVPCRFVALIGASLVVFSVAGKSPAHAGLGIAGLLLWLLAVGRLLLFGPQVGAGLRLLLAAATAKLAVDKAKHLVLFGRQAPAPAPAAAPA